MNNSRITEKRKNIICAILGALIAVVIGYLLYTNQQQEKEQTAALESLQDELEPYESELRELQADLNNLKYNISYTSEEAEILVGFVPSDVSDLSYIEEKSQTYDFTPILVLDCTMEMENVEAIIEAVEGDWEIMLFSPAFSEDINENVLSVLSLLEAENIEHSGVFLLRSDYSSTANIQLLADDGFIGYTNYNEDHLQIGQTEDGLIYFEYSYLTSSDTTVSSRLYSLYSSKSSMIVAFDMASINSGALPEAYVDALFDTMQAYTEYDDCTFSTVADVIQELSNVNSIEAENQAAYEEQAAQIQERIDELQEIIDGIE